ncbi:DUF3060 domain-containing protein [Chryseobacterium shigense]|nr:DUF3060 domain-containing protein [Chryseobacterium shigense]
MKKTLIVSILFIGIGLTQAQKNSKANSEFGTSTQKGKNIEIDGVGHNQSFSSDGGNATVSGVNNVVTIKGFAAKLEVSGSGNTIYVDKVTRVVLEGTTNKVFYKESPTKTGKPNTSITGVGNSVQKK